MNLVGRDHAGVRVLHGPPPLVSRDLDPHLVGASRRCCDVELPGHRGDGQGRKQECGNERPGYLQLGIAVHLLRNTLTGPSAVAYNRIDQPPAHQHKYYEYSPKEKPEQAKLPFRNRAIGLKNRLGTIRIAPDREEKAEYRYRRRSKETSLHHCRGLLFDPTEH